MSTIISCVIRLKASENTLVADRSILASRFAAVEVAQSPSLIASGFQHGCLLFSKWAA